MVNTVTVRRTLGVLINQIEGRYQNELVKGLESFAQQRNVDFRYFVGRSLDSPYAGESTQNSVYSLARSTRLDGLIIASGSLANFHGPECLEELVSQLPNVPRICIGGTLPNTPCIAGDNKTGIHRLVTHLVQEHGYRRIAFVAGPQSNQDARERHESFAAALHDVGLEYDETRVFQGDFSYRSGTAIAGTLVRNGRLSCDAIVCANDDMALAVLRELQHRGFRCPADFAITGFDNSPDTLSSLPSLTTILQPLFEQGRRAGESLLDLLDGKEVPALSVLPCRLLVRESCGCSETSRMSLRLNAGVASRAQAGRTIERQILDSRDTIINEILESLDDDFSRAGDIRQILTIFLDTIAFDLKSLRDQPVFLIVLVEWLEQTFEWDEFGDLWRKILMGLRVSLLPFLGELKVHAWFEDLFQFAFATLSKWMGQREARRHELLHGALADFRELANEVDSAESAFQIAEPIGRMLLRLGIPRGFIALHQQGPRPLGAEAALLGRLQARMLNRDALPDSQTGIDFEFDALDLLPPVFTGTERLSMAYFPLISRQIHFGYLALSIEPDGTPLYDYIRQEVSQALFGFFRDSERRLVESQRDQLREKLDSLSFVLIETDMALTVRQTNKVARDILGLAKTTSSSLRPFLSPADREKVAGIAAAPSREMSFALPGIRLRASDGRILPVLWLQPIMDPESKLIILRWQAIDLPAWASSNLMPDDSFFESHGISKRERTVVERVVRGSRIKDIAANLCITESTVKGHLSAIYSKFGVESRYELLDLINDWQAQRHGWDSWLLMVLGRLLEAGSKNT